MYSKNNIVGKVGKRKINQIQKNAGKLEMEAVAFNLEEVLDNLPNLIAVRALYLPTNSNLK